MYESFFGFVKRPFLAASTLDRYFPATCMEQAFQTTSRAIQRGEGPIAIFGGTGLGKTMCCLRIAESFRRNFEVIMLASSQIITRRALLQSLLFELRMPYRDLSEGELRLTLMNRLQPSTENPTDGLVLIVDEAQTLSTKLLEELRLLTNVVRNGIPRVRLVLCGTMRLEESLAHPHMESLNQRLAARCYLTPLSSQETAQYVTHKIELSGVEASSVMTRDAFDAIFRGSDGIPRLIDQLADQALLLACNDRERPVSSAMVGRAWCMLQQLPNPWSEPETISKPGQTSPWTNATPTPSVSMAPVVVATPPSPPAAATPTQPTMNSFSAMAMAMPTPWREPVVSQASTPISTVDSIEFGQLSDEPMIEPVAMKPNVVPMAAPVEARREVPRTPNVPNASSKNLLDVFSGDFDEEFTIPVQSSGSYQAYSGVAYGNLNYDLSNFGASASGMNRIEIEEANEFLSAELPAHRMADFSMPHVGSEMPIQMGRAPIHDDMEPVSNISPEQAASLERQIEEEMHELVSSLNMSAMTFDPVVPINTNPLGMRSETVEHSENDERRLSHLAHSDVVAFSGMHSFSSLDAAYQERVAMSDDRDLLVIEDEVDNVREGTQQAVSNTTRAVLHPYAKLFTKLRNS